MAAFNYAFFFIVRETLKIVKFSSARLRQNETLQAIDEAVEVLYDISHLVDKFLLLRKIH